MKLVTTIIVLFVFGFANSQKLTRGDRYFNQGDYSEAVAAYRQEKVKGERRQKHLIKRFATCYYNLFEYRKAAQYLRAISKWNLPKEDQHFYFKTYQVLQAIGDYEKALPYLVKYQKAIEQIPIDINDAKIDIERLKLKDNDFEIRKTDFNSKGSDFGATLIGNEMYFTSDRRAGVIQKDYKWTHRPYLDIFKVNLDQNYHSQGEAQPFNSTINSKWHEGNFCFTKNKQTIYISKSNTDRGGKKYDSLRNNRIHLYKSNLEGGVWTKPEKLPFNDVGYSIEHPALNKTEDTLYFSSNMKGGYGGYDLYYIAVRPDGSYGAPVNLGNKINTKHREQFPHISPLGDLFFSSDGHFGLGMLDLFVSKKTKEGFEEPINLGAPINSSYDDFSIFYRDDHNGFFSTNRKLINDDIYSFKQTGEIFPKPYTAIFEVRDYATRDIIPNATIRVVADNKFEKQEEDIEEEVFVAKRLDETSKTSAPLMPNFYKFYAKAAGYKEKTKSIFIQEKEAGLYSIFLEKDKSFIQLENIKKEMAKNIEKEVASRYDCPETQDQKVVREKLIKDVEGPPVYTKNGKMYFKLPPLYYDYGEWKVTDKVRLVLDELADKLERYKSVHLKINSHTDSRGSDEYNQILSEKRAKATRDYLALVGYVNARRLQYEGYGESQPVIPCGNSCKESEHELNRRVEFEIIKY